MRILSVTHQDDAPAGVFGDAAIAAGHELVGWRPDLDQPAPGLEQFDAALLLGGAAHPMQEDRFSWLRGEKALIASMLERDLPVLAVCLGAELVAEVAGAPARRLESPEIGWCPVDLIPTAADDPVFGGLPGSFRAFQWHSLAIELPDGAIGLADGAAGLGAFRLGRTWAMQFHAEVTAAIVGDWLDDAAADPDAVAAGFDPGPVRAETPARIAASEDLGHAICTAFLDHLTA